MVNIYIETTLQPLKRQNGRAVYILENGLNKGQTATQFGTIREKTEYEAQLLVLKDAILRIKNKSEIVIWTDCSKMAAGFRAGWVQRWQQNGWKTAKGQDVAYKELWAEILAILGGNMPQIQFQQAHEYKKWMKEELRKGARLQ